MQSKQPVPSISEIESSTELKFRIELLKIIDLTPEGIFCKKCQSLDCQHIVDFRTVQEKVKHEQLDRTNRGHPTD